MVVPNHPVVAELYARNYATEIAYSYKETFSRAELQKKMNMHMGEILGHRDV